MNNSQGTFNAVPVYYRENSALDNLKSDAKRLSDDPFENDKGDEMKGPISTLKSWLNLQRSPLLVKPVK